MPSGEVAAAALALVDSATNCCCPNAATEWFAIPMSTAVGEARETASSVPCSSTFGRNATVMNAAVFAAALVSAVVPVAPATAFPAVITARPPPRPLAIVLSARIVMVCSAAFVGADTLAVLSMSRSLPTPYTR